MRSGQTAVGSETQPRGWSAAGVLREPPPVAGHSDGDAKETKMSVNNERTEGDASSYNATLDPRTGRPPTPLEAERLKAEKLVDKALDEYLEDNGMKEGAAE